MPLQPAALELLAALSPVLARWGRWYVFGAQAVIAYGVPRLSADVDVTGEAPAARVRRACRPPETAVIGAAAFLRWTLTRRHRVIYRAPDSTEPVVDTVKAIGFESDLTP